jgi:hypothetical protein
MDDVEQVDLLPQGAEKYLLGAAGVLTVDDAVEVGEVGGAQKSGSAPSRLGRRCRSTGA